MTKHGFHERDSNGNVRKSTERIGIRLPSIMKEKLSQLARGEGKNMSEWIIAELTKMIPSMTAAEVGDAVVGTKRRPGCRATTCDERGVMRRCSRLSGHNGEHIMRRVFR